MNSLLFAGNTTLSSLDDVIRFGTLRFWAERGLIHVEDSKDNSYLSMSVRAAAHRVNAITEMLGNSPRREIYTEDQYDQINRKRHQDMIDGLQAILYKAKVQGMPTDSSARRDLNRRRPKSILVPATYGGGM